MLMKKLFLFATVAAAGLFASCSSSDDAIADAGGSPIENVDGDKAAIKIGIGNIVNTATRGTGTIGGVGVEQDNPANVWAGQRINVFMFNKITTQNSTLTLALEDPSVQNSYLYNDKVMITPGTDENKIPGMSEATDGGEAMIENGDIKYYPSTGNFDFFGYHVDDAGDGAIAFDGTTKEESTKWWIPFQISGSQDLMTTKAALTTAQATSMGGSEDYYSAKAARKNVQPTLTFGHLLTRLQFKVKAGDAASAGYGKEYQLDHYTVRTLTETEYNGLDATDKAKFNSTTYVPLSDTRTIDEYNNETAAVKAFCTAVYVDGYNAKRAVKIEEIKILSKTSGKLLVAWTADAMEAHQKIEWNDDPQKTWLTLKERPYAKKKSSTSTITAGTDYDANAVPAAFTALNDKKTALETEIADLATEIAALDDGPEKEAKVAEKAVLDAELVLLNDDIAKFWNTISEATYNSLLATADVGQDKYEILTNTVNADMVPLTPTAPTGTSPDYNDNTITSTGTDIGEALIVAPNATNDGTTYTPEALTMQVKVSQDVPTNWSDPTNLTTKSQTYNLEVGYPQTGTGSGAFKINTSYNVVLTVYGFSRIEVKTVVTEWENGGNRNVGGDDDTDWEYSE